MKVKNDKIPSVSIENITANFKNPTLTRIFGENTC